MMNAYEAGRNEKYCGQPKELKRAPEIVRAIEDMNKSVEELSMHLQTLGTRLTLVSRAETTNAKDSPPSQGACPMSSNLIAVTNKVHAMSRAVLEQIDLLEI